MGFGRFLADFMGWVLTFLSECDRIIVSLRKVGSICSVFLGCFTQF